jgi:hypothetical protein
MLRSRPAKVAGSIALGLGLLTLGALALLVLGLALPTTRALADRHHHDDWDGPEQTGAPFHWSAPMGSAKTLEIRGINGSIDAELASGKDAVVDASKTAHRSDPDQVKIEVSQEKDRVIICARYPGRDGKLQDCTSSEHGQNLDDNDVNVRFKIKVPAGVALVARNVNGAISIDGLKSEVEANTVNGSVRVATSGTASATTVNGSVLAMIGKDLSDDLEFTTVNGRVRVVMPKAVNADVKGSTVHGSIYTDFPLTVRGHGWGTNRVSGTIGKGGHELVLSTVNGSIELRSTDGKSGTKIVIDDDDDDKGDFH